MMVLVLGTLKYMLADRLHVHTALGLYVLLGIAAYALAIHRFAPELAGQLRGLVAAAVSGKGERTSKPDRLNG